MKMENASGQWNWQGLFGQDSQSLGNKSTNREMGLHQAKKLCSKGDNHHHEWTTYWVGENI
jgi:hypothetical protein